MNVGTLREAFSSEEHQPAFVLFLNDMRHAKIEHQAPIARSSTIEVIHLLIATERVAVYEDQDGDRRWIKCFRKGGPLEWYNDPDHGGGCIREVPSLFNRVQAVVQLWACIPDASSF